jgi:hypothetical protein
MKRIAFLLLGLLLLCGQAHAALSLASHNINSTDS